MCGSRVSLIFSPNRPSEVRSHGDTPAHGVHSEIIDGTCGMNVWKDDSSDSQFGALSLEILTEWEACQLNALCGAPSTTHGCFEQADFITTITFIGPMVLWEDGLHFMKLGYFKNFSQ